MLTSCHQHIPQQSDIRQRVSNFTDQFHKFASNNFPAQNFDQIKAGYENYLFSHIALIEGRSFINYVTIHQSIEKQKNSWPLKIKNDYVHQKNQFITDVKHIFENKNNLKDEYDLRDKLENAYHDFIVPFALKYADFFIQKITSQKWRNNLVEPFESFVFWLLHPSFPADGTVNIKVKKPKAELPKIYIIKTKNRKNILLVSSGCCGNLGVLAYLHTKNKFKLIPVKGAFNHISVVDSSIYTNEEKKFYHWNQNSNTLKAKRSYTNENITYKFNEKLGIFLQK